MPLSLEERDRRHHRIRTMMEEKGLSVLVVASSAMWTGHVRYFSNYVASYGYIYLVFPKEGDPTQFVFTKAMAEVASRGWVVDSRQSPDPADAIVGRVKELGYGRYRRRLRAAQRSIRDTVKRKAA